IKPVNWSDQSERQRQKPDREPDKETSADQSTATSHLQRKRDSSKSADQAGDQKRRIDGPKQHAAPQAHGKRCVEPMLPVQQDAQHQRRKSIGHNQSSRFWSQEAVATAVANNQQQFRNRQLHKNDAQDEKNSRVLFESLWLIDPKLSDRSSQNEQRNNVIFRWLRLLTAKDKERQTTSKQRKNQDLQMRQAFQVAHQFTAWPASASFSRGQPTFHETTTFEEIEHNNS